MARKKKALQVVTYPTPEAVMLRYLNCDPKFPVASLDEIEFGCEDLNQVETGHLSVSPREALKSIKEMGCWGFTDTRKRVIHAWVGAKCRPELLINFLAHEIAHNTGKPERDDRKEELRANAFGDVAAEASRLMASLDIGAGKFTAR